MDASLARGRVLFVVRNDLDVTSTQGIPHFGRRRGEGGSGITPFYRTEQHSYKLTQRVLCSHDPDPGQIRPVASKSPWGSEILFEFHGLTAGRRNTGRTAHCRGDFPQIIRTESCVLDELNTIPTRSILRRRHYDANVCHLSSLRSTMRVQRNFITKRPSNQWLLLSSI